MSRPTRYQVQPRQALTGRQCEVLELLSKGYTNGQIAAALGISLDGAKFHVSEILSRLGVASREEAAHAWRYSQRPVSRLRDGFAGLLPAKLLVGAAAVGIAAAIGMGVLFVTAGRDDGTNASGGGPPLNPATLTVDDVLSTMQAPGQAVYIEMAFDIDGRHIVQRIWHASDLRASREEHETNGVLEEITIVTPGRRAMFMPQENSLADGPAYHEPGAPEPMYTQFAHLSALLTADEVEFVGEETVAGERLLRFDAVDVRTEDEVYEEPVGTTHRTRIYLRPADLLPARLEIRTTAPGQGTAEYVFEVKVAEYRDLDTLPPDLFDPDALRDAQVSPQEALAVAGQQLFAMFWLGPRLEVPWHSPDGRGSDHQEVVEVRVAGVPNPVQPDDGTIFIGYGPPDIPSLTLIDIRQGPAGSFEPLRADHLRAIEAGGNVEPMASGEGYFYVEYMTRGTCGYEQAQRTPECRMAESGRHGAVLTRDGTLIHIVSAPKFDGAALAKDTNPFSTAEAIRELVTLLQPIP